MVLPRDAWELERLLSAHPADYAFRRQAGRGDGPMRAVAVAGDLGGVDPTHTTLFGWLAGLATATIGAIGLWMAQRVLGKAAFQTAMNDGFSKLTEQLQEERDSLRVELQAERASSAADRRSWSAEKIAWAAEKAMLVGYIRSLMQTVQSFEKRLGIEVSSVPVDIPFDQEALQLPTNDPETKP